MPSKSFEGLGLSVFDLHKEAEQASLRPKTGSPISFEWIFYERYVVPSTGEGFSEVGDEKPMGWIVTGSPCVECGDKIDYLGKTYIIREVKNDGLELTGLTLAEEI